MNLKLIKNTENINKEKITLFCLPFAGGGASAYNQWAKKMQGKVTVCPVQLPGREERIMEKPYIDMPVMLDDLEEAVREVVDGPYALWGHSMGGKISYELEKRLEAEGYRAKYLFISGSRIPSIPEPKPIYHLPDEAFKRELGRFEGTPKEILENQELLTENEYKELANHIEAIINSAALVKHMGKNSEFELINVKIVENIVDFAKNGINKDIHHMSTIGIVYGANMEKSKTIFTEYDESTLDGLENQYLRSKVKAEKVLKNAKNQGVQSSIYRMSGILFDSKTGKYQINVNESSAYIYYRNLYRLRIVPSEIQRKMDISCVDKISEAVVKLILSDDSSNDVYHVINPNGLTIKEILNCFKDCENNKDIIMKELSVEEIYNYYKKTDTKEQELFKQLVFECEIVNDIGKCDLNIGVDRTIFILEQLGFKWEKVGREEIIRAYHAIRESKKSGKKQY